MFALGMGLPLIWCLYRRSFIFALFWYHFGLIFARFSLILAPFELRFGAPSAPGRGILTIQKLIEFLIDYLMNFGLILSSFWLQKRFKNHLKNQSNFHRFLDAILVPEWNRKASKNQWKIRPEPNTAIFSKYARRVGESSILKGPGGQNVPKMALKIDAKID